MLDNYELTALIRVLDEHFDEGKGDGLTIYTEDGKVVMVDLLGLSDKLIELRRK